MSLPFYLAFAVLWVLVILQGLILLGVVRIVYQLQQNPVTASPGSSNGELQIGQEAPHFSAVDLDGTLIDTAHFAGRLTALLFVSPTCLSCTTTLAEMDALRWKAQGNVVVICRAGHDDCARIANRHKLTVPMIADRDDQIGQRFHITGVPMAVLVDENNRIESVGHPMRGEDLQGMVGNAAEAGIAAGGVA